MKRNHTNRRAPGGSLRSLKGRGYAPHRYSPAYYDWRRTATKTTGALAPVSERGQRRGVRS